jgi:hypothetical protein
MFVTASVYRKRGSGFPVPGETVPAPDKIVKRAYFVKCNGSSEKNRQDEKITIPTAP